MGLLTDLAFRLAGGEIAQLYPLTLSFRLGGSSLSLGDRVTFHAVPQGEEVKGRGLVEGNEQAYIEATIRFRSLADVPPPLGITLPPEDSLIVLPQYRYCLVCGQERVKYPGLKVTFYLSLKDGGTKTVLAPVTHDRAEFYRFSQEGLLHPVALLAPIDELLGWAGFMITGEGAVTVQFQVTIFRPLEVEDELLFFGRGVRTRGKVGRRLMFWSEGGVMARRKDRAPEVVALAQGQYYCLGELTEQMKRQLLPPELTARAFRLAGSPYS